MKAICMHRAVRPDGPENSIFGHDRRRLRRHRVHTPAYASLSGSAQAAVVELSEILDISEGGMCIQGSSQMKTNRLLPLCIELSATGSRVYLVGHVVWSESSGRTGIRFPEVSTPELKQLQEWMEANASLEAAHLSLPSSPEPFEDSSHVQAKPTSSPAYTSLINEWVEIEKDVDQCGPDLEPALHLIAQRALTLTWASGAAIALSNSLPPSEMICRARAGTESPEIGARLDASSGLSGECIRSGKAIVCDDTEYDARVDRDSCRALGVRSIVACPVKRGSEIIGVLEVFSSEPAAFWENDITVLQRLTAFIVLSVNRAQHARYDVLAFTPTAPQIHSPEEVESTEAPFEEETPRTWFRRRAVIVSVVCFAFAIWMAAPWISKLMSSRPNFPIHPSADADSLHEPYALMPLSDLRKLADQGDPAAEYALGKHYANRDAVKQDYRAAKDWFLAAAEQGHIRAQGKVAAAFWSGKGVPQDYSKAYFWALLARAGGDETSAAIVMNSAAHLSPVQIGAEQAQAELWLHNHHIGKASQ
jgi:putative methionine-R-sulfoxide reductase with GAF domain